MIYMYTHMVMPPFTIHPIVIDYFSSMSMIARRNRAGCPSTTSLTILQLGLVQLSFAYMYLPHPDEGSVASMLKNNKNKNFSNLV